MVYGEGNQLRTRVNRHESPTVPNIGYISDLTNDQHDNRTRTTPLYRALLRVTFLVSKFKECLLGLLESSLHRFDWILRELRVSHYQLVKLVPQEVCTLRPAMTIVDCEERTPWPVINLLKLGLNDVENDGYSIFIVVPDHALVRVRCIGYDNTILLACKLGRVVILSKFKDMFFFHLTVLLSLCHRHFHASVDDDRV